MSRASSAAVLATLPVIAGSILLYAQAPKALALIVNLVVMLVTGFIHDLGASGIGDWQNGFFIPNTGGLITMALLSWAAFFVPIWLFLPRQSDTPARASQVKSPNTSLERTRER